MRASWNARRSAVFSKVYVAVWTTGTVRAWWAFGRVVPAWTDSVDGPRRTRGRRDAPSHSASLRGLSRRVSTGVCVARSGLVMGLSLFNKVLSKRDQRGSRRLRQKTPSGVRRGQGKPLPRSHLPEAGNHTGLPQHPPELAPYSGRPQRSTA